MAKFWITKYALTSGIFELEGDQDTNYPSMISGKRGVMRENFHGNDWHHTREEAVLRAEVMRQAKIKSVRSQLSKLENMTF